MQVKRFFAADMRIAMKMVRDELGADAAIVGNRRVAGGVELTAVLDYPMESATPHRANPALDAELRKTQARIATAHAELSQPAAVRRDGSCAMKSRWPAFRCRSRAQLPSRRTRAPSKPCTANYTVCVS